MFVNASRPYLVGELEVPLPAARTDPRDLPEQVQRCGASGARLVAEKIETPEQLEVCRDLGFELFQGYLLSRPAVTSGRTLNPSHLNCLRLLDKLSDADISPVEVQKIIESDPGLILRFLRAAGEGAARGLALRTGILAVIM